MASRTSPMRQRKGFTIIEALVVITITGILLGVLLANYRRSNENSLLIRETASIMSRIRLAQETAASQKTTENQMHGDLTQFCENSIHTECENDSHCTGFPGLARCVNMPPAGGEVIRFECFGSEYYWYSDTVKCTANCFDGSMDPPTIVNDSDNIIIHGRDSDTGTLPHTDDYKRDIFQFDPKIELKDLRVSNAVASAKCTGPGGNRTVWNGDTTPAPTSSVVPIDRELNATIQFTSEPGDAFSANIGRKVILTDNVAPTSNDGAHTPWSKVEIMIGLTNRNTDCRVITMTNTNVLTETVDANCAF